MLRISSHSAIAKSAKLAPVFRRPLFGQFVMMTRASTSGDLKLGVESALEPSNVLTVAARQLP